MPIIVQKYGGSSLTGIPAIRRCAARAVRTHRAGHQVVVVVSAMGTTTNDLARLAAQITDCPDRKALDLLLAGGEQTSTALMTLAIQSMGVEAVALTGGSLGITTDGDHGEASIRSIDASCYRRHLEVGRIVVVAGFQGVSEAGQLTTLGRGGSDITAVAIAAALNVEESGGGCEIYTDVDGVHTADPRIVPSARRLPRISARSLLELSTRGAGVLHSRATSLAQHRRVPLRISDSLSSVDTSGGVLTSGGGTVVESAGPVAVEGLERPIVVGCALAENLARITLSDLTDTPGALPAVLETAARANARPEDMTQRMDAGRLSITFTLPAERCEKAGEVLRNVPGAGRLAIEVDLARVTVVGSSLQKGDGSIPATVFRGLCEAGIDLIASHATDTTISCFVPHRAGREAMRIIHDALGLGEMGEEANRFAPMPQVEFVVPAHATRTARQAVAEAG